MKIFALTVAGASSYFRLQQYKTLFEEAGILETADENEADCVIVQKSLFALSKQCKLRKKAKKLIFDFDDAIWTRPIKPYSLITSWRIKARLHYWLKKADLVTCSSSYLADYASKFSKPHVIAMSVDTDLWKPAVKTIGPLTIGWAGAPHNLHHLEALDPILKALGKSVRLRVFSGERPKLSVPFDFEPFSEKTQIPFIQSLDIGLLPLQTEEFSLGKSPIKAIQYIACGLPVIGNVQGATNDILKPEFSIAVQKPGEWLHALKTLASNEALRQSMGQKARQFAMQHHSLKTVGQSLINLLKG